MGIHGVSVLYFIIVISLSCREISIATDTLDSSHPISDNTSTTLVSSGQKFQLGFFSPINSKNRYIGIWYYNIPNQTVVWVANRENPLHGSGGILKIGDDGNLILLNQTERVTWSTNIQNISSVTSVAQLLDSGNLVVRDESNGNVESFLWQSFDHPCDTLLTGLKLGWDLGIGLDRNLTSWKSADDPSPGDFSLNFDLRGLPQFVLRKGSIKLFRTGVWDGVGLNGVATLPNELVINSKEVYFEVNVDNQSNLTMSVLSLSGMIQHLLWNYGSLEWLVIGTLPDDQCDNYGYCGSNAICMIDNTLICSCLTGYIPKSSQDWDLFIWSSGCIRQSPLNCPTGEGFIDLEGVKMPDLLQFSMNASMTLEACKMECLRNCSCTAYANSDVTGGGSGCLLWFGDLIDIRKLKDDGNNNFYIRVTASDLESISDAKKKKKLLVVEVTIAASIALVFFFASFILWKRRSQQGTHSDIQTIDEESLELPIFSMITISEATQNFSCLNKIGEGGFGSVFKGVLLTGQEIAVKRLSHSSGQGFNEFKNEVRLIAKLQHRNLVRLSGCCIQGEERMLVYEYMHNGSLDSFIFVDKDNTRHNFLVWERRFDIIVGIARGLLYLHRDSRLRIIHRDLKPSNVLLDKEMNPKISDFGMARDFGVDQSLAKTRRVAGTYGYMSPEYAIDGIFSMKSDVFSFGVLVLEIVSGKKNSQFHHPDHDFNLLGHAWKLWIEGKAFELLDPHMEDSVPISEVLRCIQIALLCVQRRVEARPTMSSVLLMLDGVSTMLPQPQHPGFYIERSPDEIECQLDGKISTTNEVTNTLLEGR